VRWAVRGGWWAVGGGRWAVRGGRWAVGGGRDSGQLACGAWRVARGRSIRNARRSPMELSSKRSSRALAACGGMRGGDLSTAMCSSGTPPAAAAALQNSRAKPSCHRSHAGGARVGALPLRHAPRLHPPSTAPRHKLLRATMHYVTRHVMRHVMPCAMLCAMPCTASSSRVTRPSLSASSR